MNSVRNLCGTIDVDGFSREERKLVRTKGKSQKTSKPKPKLHNNFKGNLDHNMVNKINK